MKRIFQVLMLTAAVGVASVFCASPAEAGGSFGFSFGYHSGHFGYHYRDYYCGPRYFPRSYISYSYVYAPPPVVYYSPPPVIYYAPPPPPPAPRSYYRSGTFQSY